MLLFHYLLAGLEVLVLIASIDHHNQEFYFHCDSLFDFSKKEDCQNQNKTPDQKLDKWSHSNSMLFRNRSF